MTESSWLIVYSTSEIHNAVTVKNILEENGIHAVIDDRRDSNYIMLGEIEVRVNSKDVVMSKFLIDKNQL